MNDVSCKSGQQKNFTLKRYSMKIEPLAISKDKRKSL